MNATSIASLIAGGSFLVTALFHLCLCRALPTADRLRLLFRLLPVMLACAAAGTALVYPRIAVALRDDFKTVCVGCAAIALCILFVGTLSFYSAITHSVRLHIGHLLAAAPDASRTEEDVISLYDAEDATRRRVRQLLDGGYLQDDGDLLRLTPKGLACAAISSGGKRLFRAGPGG